MRYAKQYYYSEVYDMWFTQRGLDKNSMCSAICTGKNLIILGRVMKMKTLITHRMADQLQYKICLQSGLIQK